ncbi:hypothetical protein JZ751_028575 [Albula glossodonta]|uniref:Galactose-3-O-sulfotransferase 2 n=1 Tax=Albula glossodonta TaxID=121402 RepID=A0A8T2NIV3_9TELE|nr:hypothetical protein JZ751_028575 [Albula glossodonta]
MGDDGNPQRVAESVGPVDGGMWSVRRLRGVLCSHLRFMWIALMVLTVLCVAMQILGVVRQSRNDKVLKQFANEKLFSMRLTIEFQETLATTQQPSERRQSDHVPLIEYIQDINQGMALRRERNNQQAGIIPGVGLQQDRRARKITTRGKPGRLTAAAAAARTEEGKSDVSKSSQPAPRFVSEVLRPRGNHFATRGSAVSPRFTQPKPQHSLALLAASQRGINPKNLESLRRMFPSLPRTTSHLLSAASANIAAAEPAAAGAAVARAVPACQPKTHIVFLKTHKTASSTILNILYRYGDSRNLTFALPLNKHSQLFYPMYFAAHFVEGFRSRAVKRVMPEDSFYFSVLRNPVSMMESIFIYYKSIPAFHKARSLDDFLTNAAHSYNTSQTNNHYARNLLAYDFGFDNNNNVVDIERQANLSISTIEKSFHLILISEYFDESMILLKNALCWSLDDVVSFKLNSRSNRTRQVLSPGTMEKIKAWNLLDWKIYSHFNATFWRRVEETVGEAEMRREVAQLQERRSQLMKTCLKEGGAVDPSQVKDSALKPFQYGAAVIQGYNLNPGLSGATRKQCQDLITPELQYTSALYTKQFPELAAKLVSSQKQAAANRAMPPVVRTRTERQRRSLLSNPNRAYRNQTYPSPTRLP